MVPHPQAINKREGDPEQKGRSSGAKTAVILSKRDCHPEQKGAVILSKGDCHPEQKGAVILSKGDCHPEQKGAVILSEAFFSGVEGPAFVFGMFIKSRFVTGHGFSRADMNQVNSGL
jgi:hypothetical protein